MLGRHWHIDSGAAGQYLGGLVTMIGKYSRNGFVGTQVWLQLPVLPNSLSSISSSSGQREGEMRESIRSVPPADFRVSGRVANTEQLWENFFADPAQWLDNRSNKKNSRAPDFKHRLTREVLWVDGRSNPPWVKSKLFAITQSKVRLYVGANVQVPHGAAYPDPKRLSVKNHTGWRGNSSTITTKRLRQGVDKSDFDTGRHGRPLIKKGEAMAILHSFDEQDIPVDSNTYAHVLQSLCKMKDLVVGKQVHDHIIQSGVEPNISVVNNLIKLYIDCGSLVDARQLFDKVLKKNVVTWTIMIGGYAQRGHGEEAFEIFRQMQQESMQPNAVTYLSILNACTSPIALKWGKEVHAHIINAGLQVDVRVGTALVKMYAKCGSITNARRVFDSMIKRDIILWTVMIRAYAESGHCEKAFEVFLQMQQHGVQPDTITYTVLIGAYVESGNVEMAFEVFHQMGREGLEADPAVYLSILNACASPVALKWGKNVHAHIVNAGFQSNIRAGNALIKMYSRCGRVNAARQVFDRMVDRDVITWSAMIRAYAENGLGDEAFEVFLKMRQEGPEPTAITYLSLLNPCASPGALEWVKEVHVQALEAGLMSDVRVGNALVNMYAKSGSIEDARRAFDKMVKRDVISWNVMIGGLAQHGCGQEALQFFEQMKREGFRPNEFSFVGVLSACSHAGLVDECRRHFSSMTQDYGIRPTVEHYGCMVDLLGRAGHLDEAESVITNMPLEASAGIWGTLLGACRIHGNVKLAEVAAEHCLKLEPENAGMYVLLSNIYAAAGMWDRAVSVRNLMKERGVRKEAGRSWIEVDKKVHSFVVEDRSHPEAEEIYAELERLTKEMKRAGYIPDTRFVMHDVDEQRKAEALCFHSEKLAIAYGLIKTPAGTPIRIFKNLRVCPDCHTATKFISKVVGREIVARDANRFHHVKDGVCSCGDYW